MVASTHWLASAAGMAVLEQGGNAFDAAVAAGLTLQVVEPHLNGPGGDLPAILWPAARGEPIVLCAQGPAPRAATIARYRDDLGLTLVPGTGPLAAVVPGAFGGWLTMLARVRDDAARRRAALRDRYAENGYPGRRRIAARSATSSRCSATSGRRPPTCTSPLPSPGTLHRNPQLAADVPPPRRGGRSARGAGTAASSPRRSSISRSASGWTARAPGTAACSRRTTCATGARRSRSRSPSTTTARPCSRQARGARRPVFLQQLRLLEGFDLAAMGHASADYVHTVTECAKLAFADREAWYGDPDFVDVPIDMLLSREYADERRAPRRRRVVGRAPARRRRPAPPAPVAARRWRPASASRRAATPSISTSSTAGGTWSSATPSGGWLQGAPVIPELGFCLGTRAQMFWLEEGFRTRSRRGSARGRRSRRRSSPATASRTRVRHAGRRPAGPVDAARLPRARRTSASTSRPRSTRRTTTPRRSRRSFYPRETVPRHVAVEARAGGETIDGLRRARPRRRGIRPWSLGRVSAVARDPDGQLRAGANPRGMQGYAVVADDACARHRLVGSDRNESRAPPPPRRARGLRRRQAAQRVDGRVPLPPAGPVDATRDVRVPSGRPHRPSRRSRQGARARPRPGQGAREHRHDLQRPRILPRQRRVPIVFASSREVYGDVHSSEEYVETSADFGFAASTYAASKIAGEAFVYAYARCYDLPYLVFRFSNVYGRFDNDLAPDGACAAALHAPDQARRADHHLRRQRQDARLHVRRRLRRGRRARHRGASRPARS